MLRLARTQPRLESIRYFHSTQTHRILSQLKKSFTGIDTAIGLSGEQFYHFSNFRAFIQQLKQSPQLNQNFEEFYEKFIKNTAAPHLVWRSLHLILLHKSNRATLNARLFSGFILLFIVGWALIFKDYLQEKNEEKKKSLEIALISQFNIILAASFLVQFCLKRLGFRVHVEPNYRQLVANNKQKMFVIETPTWIPMRFQQFSVPQNTVLAATIVEPKAKRPNVMLRQRIDVENNETNPWFQRFYKNPSNTSFTARGLRFLRSRLPFSDPKFETLHIKSYIIPTRSQKEAQELIAWVTEGNETLQHTTNKETTTVTPTNQPAKSNSINRFF